MFCKLRRLELLRSGQLSDCELHVLYLDKCQKSCCRQFRCHKVMLVSASDEFKRIINEPEFEKNKRIMRVNDASPDAYETLLLYIYTYEIYNEINIEMYTDLIYLSSKYKMPDFVDGYIGKLANQNWPMGTVLKIFQLANGQNRPAIMKLVEEKIAPIANQLLNDNSFLRFSLKELYALFVILKSVGTIPDRELLLALRKYQVYNNLHYGNMTSFQQFVEVTHLFGNVLFEADGTLAITDDVAALAKPQSAEKQKEPESAADPEKLPNQSNEKKAGQEQLPTAANEQIQKGSPSETNQDESAGSQNPPGPDTLRSSIGSTDEKVQRKSQRSSRRSSSQSSKRRKS